MNLIINYALRRIDKSDIMVIVSFRKLQEISSAKEASIQEVFETIASKFEISGTEVKIIRDRWMIDNQKWPLIISKRRWLAKQICHLRKKGVLVAIWSDNPIEKKLKYLGFESDFNLSSEDPEIDIGKPNPKGLIAVLSHFQLNFSEAVLIGDRMDRDGLAAQRAGIRFQMVGLKTRILLYKINKDLKSKHFG